ncbi:hypothetical protein J2B92_19355 [Lysinibacillus sphaericus]|uniref:hypothetical protein n=1 Tax=Lysinibacillus sphaericus TaxID=1421 RepID=UPI0018CE1272|nr:hypothetical protein [Lysinibacillus sphaericus]MBG9757284.1 hypothetical protein [Lysinibacillus sphaericus]QTB12931.1 hypothetical protein J2B92_19355 [Lysinibacillus sphaericus]
MKAHLKGRKNIKQVSSRKSIRRSSNLYRTKNYLAMNHEEIFKTYKNIAKQVKHLKGKNFAKPTSQLIRVKKRKKGRYHIR